MRIKACRIRTPFCNRFALGCLVLLVAVLLTGFAQPASAQQTLFTTETPVLTGYNDGVSYELGMKFQSSVSGQITAIRYWKDVKESGTHVGHIWSSTGTLLASATFAGETASGWQQQALYHALTISPNTAYVVSVNTTFYVDTVGGLFFPVSNGALISIADDDNGLFGRPGTFPTQSYRQSNYFRDVVFTPGVTNPPQPAGCLEKLVSVDGGKTFAAHTNLNSPAVAQFNSSFDPVQFELVVTNCGTVSVTPGTVNDCVNANPNAAPFACAPASAGGQGAPGLILYEPPTPAPTSAALSPDQSATYSKTQLPNLSITTTELANLCHTASLLTPPQTVVRNDARFDGTDANGAAVSYEADAYVQCPLVPPSGTLCNGVYLGTFKGDLTVSSGQTCIIVGGGVTGNVTETGGSLILSNATIGNNVQVNGGGTFSFGQLTTIKGNLEIHNIPAGAAQNQVCATNVAGNLQFHNNGTAVLIGSGSPSCPGNVIRGNLEVHENTAATAIFGNTVGGNLQDQNNTASAEVFQNVVTHSLQCQNNTSITGGGNSASQKQGQCAGF